MRGNDQFCAAHGEHYASHCPRAYQGRGLPEHQPQQIRTRGAQGEPDAKLPAKQGLNIAAD